MKFVITESRMHRLMTDHLNSFKEANDVHHMDNFIIISRLGDNNFANAEMEYDSSDGRLFIDQSFLNTFTSWFGRNTDYSESFIAKWFEKEFDVEIKYTQS